MEAIKYEIDLQIKEYIIEQCKLGNQNKSLIYDQLKSNGISVKIGKVSRTVDQYIESLYK